MTKESVRYLDGFDVYQLDFSKSYAFRVRKWFGRIDAWLRQFEFDEEGINGLKIVCAIVLVWGGWCAGSFLIG